MRTTILYMHANRKYCRNSLSVSHVEGITGVFSLLILQVAGPELLKL